MVRSSAERDEAERPFIAQLTAMMSWTHIPGADLTEADREPGQPLLVGRLKSALRRINRLPGQPGTWLDDDTVDEAVSRLQRVMDRADGPTLLDVNREATGLLLSGTPLRAPGGREERVQYIDWTDLDSPHNEFLVVSQFRVSTPGGRQAIPDLVLFVNGIPLAVVECKSPDLRNSLGPAIRDLRAYTGDPLREDEPLDGESSPTGIPNLFATTQLLIAADGRDAVMGTITSDEKHFSAWRSAKPDYGSEQELRRRLREHQLVGPEEAHNGQHRLIAVVLRKRTFLSIVRHYLIELPLKNAAGDLIGRVKVVCRYQQYRAVERIIRRLRTGRTRLDLGTEEDERGGVIWHTQGSGKSLTMAFLTRRLHLHPDPELNAFTILVVTDREQLQDQLAEVLRLSESSVRVAGSQADVESMLEHAGRPGGRAVIFAMIQKYVGRIPGLALNDDERDDRDLTAEFEHQRERIERGEDPEATENLLSGEETVRRRIFRQCSDSPRVLVLIDEAHRSHSSVLHACLRDSVPNAARIGFTGTPIIQGRRKLTEHIFGPFLDVYRMDDAERDRVVVPVRYEGRTGPARVVEGEQLDETFHSLIARLDDTQREQMRKRWGNPTARDVAESASMIRAKAADMLEHYVLGPLSGGFKAQVAAVSRRAVVMYRHALRDARAELLARVRDFDPERLRGTDPATYSREDLLLLRAWHYQPVLRRIDFVPIISAGDEVKSGLWRDWTDSSRRKGHIARFLQPFPELPPDNPWAAQHTPAGPGLLPMGRTGLNPWSGTAPIAAPAAEEPVIAFLIVKSMLLTGFDAPIEQVLYLDRPIRDAELLQAVARVNRTARGKDHGLVVDYYGVLSNLTVTLSAYRDDSGVRQSMRSLESDLPELQRAARTLTDFLRPLGGAELDRPGGVNRTVRALADETVRAAFDERLGTFMDALERVLPHEKALPHIVDAQRWGLLQKRARRLYRDAPNGDFSLHAYGRKVRGMIADHLQVAEINEEIPPVSITDPSFDSTVERIPEAELAAAEQVQGLRYHLEERERGERPEVYRELSQALEDVLSEFEGRWEEISDRLRPLIERARRQEQADPATAGLSPVERLLHAQLADGLARDEGAFGGVPPSLLRTLAVEVCAAITKEVSLASFGNRQEHQDQLEATIFQSFRQVLRKAGQPRDVEAARVIARLLTGHVRENLPQYRRAGRGGDR